MKSKTKQRKKQKITKMNLKKYLKNWCFYISVSIVSIVFILIYFFCLEIFKREMLLWFFAATSQSMAALFAVVGMFLVFRYQDLQSRLSHYNQILRNSFMSPEWRQFFGYKHEDFSVFSDTELLSRAERYLEEKKDESQHRAYNNLEVTILVIKSHMDVRDNIINLARIPMIAILLTFLFSIFSIIFMDIYFSLFSINILGFAAVLIIVVLIIFSTTSIIKYFMLSIPTKG